MVDSPRHAARNSPVDIFGRMAGEYRLGRKLGEGGFGTVYEAEHPLLKRRAAVKVLHQASGVDSEAVLRFISEAQAVNQIKSRHLVDVFSFGVLADGRHFYVMDLLKGEPLDRYLDRHVRCDVPTAIQLLRPIAETLDLAHAAGIVHRDLKPQNIYLAWEPSGETVPKLLDFGMAKLAQSTVRTASGTPVGTPLYMSPEQARGDKVDGRADVYAFGVLCHELLTGKLPINGESAVVVLVAHLTQAPPRVSEVRSDLAPELDAPILRMLEKQPEARPATAGEALRELISAAEKAGYEIPSGLPRLALPPERDEPSASEPDSFAPTQPLGSDLEATTPDQDANRQGLVRSAQISRHSHALPLYGALLLLGGAAAYLGLSAMGTSEPSPAKTHADSAASVAPVAAASEPPSALASAVPPSASALQPSVAASSAADADAVPSAAASNEAPSEDAGASATSVAVTLRGAPPGARIWLDGKAIGEAPGPVSLPRGTSPLRLTVTAGGFEPAIVTLTPDRAQAPSVKLRRHSVSGSHSQIPSDLESPF